MTDDERTLLRLLENVGPQSQAILLQSFIAENGPLSEEAATEVRKLLEQEK